MKALLVDDWENITKNLLLVSLPSEYSANKIVDEYFEEERAKRREGSADADILEEIVAGLKQYFEKALGRILLYRFEREQFAELRDLWMKPSATETNVKGPGDVYGAEHLVRLIGKYNAAIPDPSSQVKTANNLFFICKVTMPELIAQTNMDQQSVHRFREEMSKFCLYIARNAAKYFTGQYEAASQEYVDKARGD